MFIEDRQTESHIKSALFAFLVLGVVYSQSFSSRKDWVALSDLVEFESVTKKIRNNLLQSRIGDDFLFSLEVQDRKSRIYDLQAAIGLNRIKRMICETGVQFCLDAHQARRLEHLYFYDYKQDFGPYRLWPPSVGRLLSPFLDYFEVSGKPVVISERLIKILNPVIKTPSGETSLTSLNFEFEDGAQLRQLFVGWRDAFLTELSIRDSRLNFVVDSAVVAELEFSCLGDALAEVTSLFVEILND